MGICLHHRVRCHRTSVLVSDSSIRFCGYHVVPRNLGFSQHLEITLAESQEIKRNCEAIEKQLGERLFYAATSSKDEHRLPDLNELIEDYWKLRYRRTIQSWKTKSWPIVVTHNLVNDIEDDILKFLRSEQMVNSPMDRVKVVYHPDFIESTNPLFGLDYGQFVRGCHLGIFPSYYEPWGYTPLECIARGVPAVTSNLSGFGKYVQGMEEDTEDTGVYGMNR